MLKVTEEAYPYLAIQRGEINELREFKDRFVDAYNDTIARDLGTMKPALPPRCRSLIDIGSGMGGIDILLQRYYGEECEVYLVDGLSDPPYHTVRADEKTFSNEQATRGFWFANEAHLTQVLDAAKRAEFQPIRADLIVSLFSWCFHYPPELYLDWVLSCCHKETVVIADLRRSTNKTRILWQQKLEQHFRPSTVLWVRPKFTRVAWVLR